MNEQQIFEDVCNGNISPLLGYAQLESAKKNIEGMLSQIKEDAMEEAEKMGIQNGAVERWGYKISRVASRANYDYKGIRSWVDKKMELSNIEELAKLAAKTGKQQVDPDTGELIDPAIVTYSKEGISIKSI